MANKAIYNCDYSRLRGRIREKAGTECEFAKKIGKSQSFVIDVFKGRSYFSYSDILTSCNVLDIEQEEIPAYFFALKTTER